MLSNPKKREKLSEADIDKVIQVVDSSITAYFSDSFAMTLPDEYMEKYKVLMEEYNSKKAAQTAQTESSQLEVETEKGL